MSLVYEALQKAEREKGRKTGNAPVAAPVSASKPVAPTPVAPAASRNYLLPLIAIVSLVAIVAIVYLVVVVARHTPATQSAGGTRSVASESKGADLTEQVPPTESAPPAARSVVPVNPPEFKLTGIMKMGESYAAVINGHVVYEEFYVDGATVKKIEKDRVTLTFNDREVLLRLN